MGSGLVDHNKFVVGIRRKVRCSMLVVNERIKVPLKELQFTYSRSQGPGGQNVNKLNTKALLRWPVMNTESLPPDVKQRFLAKYRRRITNEGDLLITSQRFRDRGRNVADCLSKLQALLVEVSVAPTKRKKSKPTKGSRVRRRKQKEANSQKKQRRQSPGMDS